MALCFWGLNLFSFLACKGTLEFVVHMERRKLHVEASAALSLASWESGSTCSKEGGNTKEKQVIIDAGYEASPKGRPWCLPARSHPCQLAAAGPDQGARCQLAAFWPHLLSSQDLPQSKLPWAP